MSLIRELGGVAEVKHSLRWYTVLEADDVLDAPKLEFQIKYVPEKKYLALIKPYQKKDGTVKGDDLTDFRKAFIVEAVCNWKGMCTINAKRLCAIFFEHPEYIAEETPSVWPFDLDDLTLIAEHMVAMKFNELTDACMELGEFIRASFFEQKKSSKS